MATAGFRNSLTVPAWLSDRPALQYAWRTIWSVAMLFDVMLEGVEQGVASAFPGYGTATALPLIGRNRGLSQGSAQTDDAFAADLRGAVADWQDAGGDYALCKRLQRFIPGTPVVRVVNRGQRWVTLNADGTVTYLSGTTIPAGAYTPFTYASTAVLNWDSNSNPGDAGRWADIWIIVENAGYPAETRSLTTLAATYASFAAWAATGFGVGQQVPRADVNAIHAIIQTWKAAHANVKSVIFSYSSDFDPTVGPTANGYCEKFSYLTSGTANTAQRPSAGRYWQLAFSFGMGA